MTPAFSRSLKASFTEPAPLQQELESRLNVTVVFTSVDATSRALKRASTLAESLSARITLVVPQIVPYPLPLTTPPVLLEFQEKRFEEIAAQSRVDITVQIYLCRDAMDTLKKVLEPHSLIVVGGRKRFWPTLPTRLVRRLRKAGHEVILEEVN